MSSSATTKTPRWRGPSPMFLIPLTVGTAVALTLIFGVSYLTRPVNTPTTTVPSALVGQTATLKSLPDLSGHTVTLPYRTGTPTILVFFASWCEPCRKELPVVETFYRQQPHSGVQFVGVASNDTSSGTTQHFVNQLGFYPSLLVFDANGDASSSDFNIVALPDTIAIDAHGIIRDVVTGSVTPSELQHMVRLIR